MNDKIMTILDRFDVRVLIGLLVLSVEYDIKDCVIL